MERVREQCNSSVTMIDTRMFIAEAQVLLRWATQRGIAVIPKSNDQGRLVANLDCNSFDLSESELSALSALNINLRVRKPISLSCCG
jgi:diketogulonate reductase-like aldo/keto reductase